MEEDKVITGAGTFLAPMFSGPTAKKFKCQDCGGESFLEGPSGGLSVNFACADDSCNARYNYGLGIDRHPADCKVPLKDKRVLFRRPIDIYE